MNRVGRYNQILSDYDRELYATERYGRIDVMRKGFKLTSYDVDGSTVLVPERNDWYVFSLTHNWVTTGNAVEWGIEPLLKHLKECDLWRRDVFQEYFKAKDELDDSMDRNLDNKLEAFWKDNRRAWAKNFENNITGSLKLKDRRFLDEKKLKLKGN